MGRTLAPPARVAVPVGGVALMPRDGELRLDDRATMVPVTSSNVAAVGYDRGARRLYVRFLAQDGGFGSLYEYEGVPVEIFDVLMETEEISGSVGRAFNELVKRGGFTYRRVE